MKCAPCSAAPSRRLAALDSAAILITVFYRRWTLSQGAVLTGVHTFKEERRVLWIREKRRRG